MANMRMAPPDRPDAKLLKERRRSVRYSHLTRGRLFDEHAGPASEGTEIAVFNVSRHGVGFRADIPLMHGVVYRVKIGAGPLHLASFIRVISCRESDDGFCFGAEFC